MSARSAFRDGPRTPRAAHPRERRTPTCHAAVATPISDERTAVVAYPPTAVARRLAGSSASGPPTTRAAPLAPSAIPSISPSAAAARDAPRPSVSERNDGRSAVGTSCPRSESRLAAPIARTPGRNQRCSSASALRRRSLEAEPARLDGRRARPQDPQTETPLALDGDAEAAEGVAVGRCGNIAVLQLQLDRRRGGRRGELAEQRARLHLDVDRQLTRAERQRADAGDAARQGGGLGLEGGGLEQLGELGVEPTPAECGLREVRNLGGHGIGPAKHGAQFVEQLVVGIGIHAVPPCRAGFEPT